MEKQLRSKMRPRDFRLNLNYFNKYKMIGGKKYQYNGTVPLKMKEDIIKVYQRHNLILKVEVDKFDKEMIQLWYRRK